MSQIEQFGKYILLEKLATGGMAEVYLAKSTGANGFNKFLAIKRILPQYSEVADYIEMFKEEAKIAVNLNHSNVVSIFDFGVERKQFFLVMEYVEGRNLRQIINEVKKNSVQFTIEQIVYMIKEVAAGLDHAHRCIDGSTGRPLNITHRDMSPQNIMLSFEGEVKIIDFGIAKAETQIEATKAGTLKGKFGYMSPEQAEGQQVDLRTDIFSLGIVLWELLANDRLFTASSEAAILRKIRDCQIPSIRKINPSIPPELERIVNKALAKDKSLRYQTSAAMHRDLNRFLNTQYPEFTPHDFSVFIKNTFSSAYQEQKRKLVEFANLQMEDRPLSMTEDDDKTSVTTNTDVTEDDSMEFLGTGINQSSISKVELNGIRESIDRTEIRRGEFARSESKNSSFTPPSFRAPKMDINWDRHLPLIMRGVAVLIVVGAVMLLYSAIPDRLLTVVYWKETLRNMFVTQPTPTGQKHMASKAEYYVTIHSNPTGAEIYINGKKVEGIFTPGQIKVEGHKPFHLTLRKQGEYLVYEPFEEDILVERDATVINAKLEPLTRAGYVTLELQAAGDDPIIEINGKRIGEKLPITNYPVRAGVSVPIRVRNTFTGMYAEEKVVLGDNQKRTVYMILRPDERARK